MSTFIDGRFLVSDCGRFWVLLLSRLGSVFGCVGRVISPVRGVYLTWGFVGVRFVLWGKVPCCYGGFL